MGAQQAPPGVRSELALITNQEITAWGWGVGERQKEGGGGGQREGTPPATGSSYPGLRLTIRDFLK